jgi:hypothetical protein
MSADMVGAVEAGPGSDQHGPDLILSIINDGARVTIADQPVLCWLTPLPPGAPVPVTVDSLPLVWAHVVITPHSGAAELIGSPRVDVYVPDTWRGTFIEFLDWLTETTGLPVIGTQLCHGALVHGFGSWLGIKYGGRMFGP